MSHKIPLYLLIGGISIATCNANSDELDMLSRIEKSRSEMSELEWQENMVNRIRQNRIDIRNNSSFILERINELQHIISRKDCVAASNALERQKQERQIYLDAGVEDSKLKDFNSAIAMLEQMKQTDCK